MRKNHGKRRHAVWFAVYCAALAAFSVYAVMDTFVITHVYTQVEAASVSSSLTTSTDTTQSDTSTDSETSTTEETDTASSDTTDTSTTEDTSSDTTATVTTVSTASLDSAEVLDEQTYSDSGVSITLTTYREYDTTFYVADVQLASADYLQTALAGNAYGKNVKDTTSDIADSVNAILAINGDYYGSQESGYVIRGGVLYRDTAQADQEDLVIYEDGSFEIINESDVTAEELLEAGAVNVLSFGPGLVEDGEIAVTESEEVGKAKASNPRTAIGIIDDLHYVFVVSDGRTSESTGLSLYQLATIMDELGCTTAYNLDGGGSSTMVFQGTVVNNPTTDGRTIKEREVSDIVYIGTEGVTA